MDAALQEEGEDDIESFTSSENSSSISTDEEEVETDKEEEEEDAASVEIIPEPLDPRMEKPDHFIVVGIDPGSVHTGLCKYDAIERKVLDMDLLQLRPSGRKANSQEITNALKESMNQEGGVLRRFLQGVDRVGVEDQVHTGNDKQMAQQHVLYSEIGKDVCSRVFSHAVKSRFRRYFPLDRQSPERLELLDQKWLERYGKVDTVEAKTKRMKKRIASHQKLVNKRNAVKYGRLFVPKEIRHRIDQEHPKKKDDVYDAYWIARYFAEVELERIWGIETHEDPAGFDVQIERAEKRRKRERRETLKKERSPSKRKKKEEMIVDLT